MEFIILIEKKYTDIIFDNLSFQEPVMDLEVDSNFEGKKLPKLTSFIHSQICKVIRKKHTLPRYKVRYKPFFVKEEPQDGKNEVRDF